MRWTRDMESIRVRMSRTPIPAPSGIAALLVVVVVVVVVVVPIVMAAPGASSPAMHLPLPGTVSVVTPFDPPEKRWLAGHRGVDLAGTPLSPVLAPAEGTVLFAGTVAGRPVLSIGHGAGLRTTYEPVRATVREGESVLRGETVAHLVAGHPGCPVDACLHWGARVASGGPSGDDDDYVDPMGLLSDDDRPIRLKPTLPGDGAS